MKYLFTLSLGPEGPLLHQGLELKVTGYGDCISIRTAEGGCATQVSRRLRRPRPRRLILCRPYGARVASGCIPIVPASHLLAYTTTPLHAKRAPGTRGYRLVAPTALGTIAISLVAPTALGAISIFGNVATF